MVEFTQYLRPDGRRRSESIDRPPKIEQLANKFMEAGGRYECEVLTDNITVSLTAVFMVNGEEQDIVIKLCPNGPNIPDKVDQLVQESIEYLNKPKFAKEN